MPLAVRTNGSTSANIITASWFNDIRDLLTGTMKDQEVSIKNNLALLAIGAGPTVTPGGSLAAGTTLGIGLYKYVYTWVSADGETLQSPTFSITTTTSNQNVSLTGIATGVTGTTARNIYRTAVGGSVFHLLTTINDNTTTTFLDSATDASIAANAVPPTYPSFGGSLLIKNSAGTVVGQWFNDGTISVNNLLLAGSLIATNLSLSGSLSAKFANLDDPSPPVLNGATSGTLTIYQITRGTTVKITLLVMNNFKNGGGSVQTLGLPVGYTNRALFFVSDFPGFTVRVGSGGSDITTNAVITALASGGGSTSLFTTGQNWSIGELRGPFDTYAASSGNGSSHSGLMLLIGV